MRGIKVDIPRTSMKRSHVLPLPGGEGRVRGKALSDSPSRPLSFKSLLIPPKIAKNHLDRLASFSPLTLNSTIKPIYLFADSQLLFWKADGSLFLASVRSQLEASSPTAAYIGASNGDNPVFYSIFTSAMERVGIQNCRLIRAGFPADDKKFLDRADLILLAGGDIKRGWEAFEKSGIKQCILQRYSEGAVLLGISAGAVQLGLLGWPGDFAASSDELFETFKLVPFVIGVHEEKDGWKNLRQILHLESGAAKGLGIPAGGGLIYHRNQTIEPIRMPVILVSMENGKVTENLLFPAATKVG